MKSISMDGIGAKYVTFYTEEDASAVGKVCTLSGNDTVKASADGEKFCGILISVKDGIACVQVGGCCELPYSGTTAPSVGYCSVAAASGGVAVGEKGKEVLVYHVDTTAKTVGMVL